MTVVWIVLAMWGVYAALAWADVKDDDFDPWPLTAHPGGGRVSSWPDEGGGPDVRYCDQHLRWCADCTAPGGTA